jgi:hypothetical protein
MNMKSAALVVSIVISLGCLSTVSVGQGFVRFGIGPAFPLGDFSANDYERDGTGLARTGIMTEIAAGIPVYKNLGVSISARYQRNKFDGDIIGRDLGGEVKSNSWKSYGILIGPYYDIHVGSILTITPYAGIGIIRSHLPKMRLRQDLSQFIGWSETEFTGSAESAFAGVAGIVLKGNASRRVVISLTSEVTLLSQEFERQRVFKLYLGDSDQASNIQISEGLWAQEMNTISVMAGVGFKLSDD